MRFFPVLAAAAGLYTAVVQGQLSPAPGSRAIVHEVGLPPIDRGLRDQDPPRPARTAANAAQFSPNGSPARVATAARGCAPSRSLAGSRIPA